MSKIKIIYGTGGGNTELTCKKVASILNKKGHKTELIKAKLADISDISEKNYDLLILASPTYGHGLLENYFNIFFNKIQNADLKGTKCALISLGDVKYDMDHFLESAKIIDEFLKQKEAKIVCDPLKIAMTPVTKLDNMIKDWAENLAKNI